MFHSISGRPIAGWRARYIPQRRIAAAVAFTGVDMISLLKQCRWERECWKQGLAGETCDVRHECRSLEGAMLIAQIDGSWYR